MEQIIRSLIPQSDSEAAEATANLKGFSIESFTNVKLWELELLEYIIELYSITKTPVPHAQLEAHFTQVTHVEVLELLNELQNVEPLTGSAFVSAVAVEVSNQNQITFKSILRRSLEVATKGIREGTGELKGVQDAVRYIAKESVKLLPSKSHEIHEITSSKSGVRDVYKERSDSKNQFGIPTGYSLIDTSTAGIRPGQMYLLGGYTGHLKTTLTLNSILNAAVDTGWNAIFFSSEMSSDDVELLMVAIHSAHPKFYSQFKPIPAYNLILGALTNEQETTFNSVREDLESNSEYGTIKVLDSRSFVGLNSVEQIFLREREKADIDIIWVDYITRLPPDRSYQRMDIVQSRNEMIAEFKRIAMRNKVAVGSPVQINREGYKRASSSDVEQRGRMDTTALAQYNAIEREADVISYIFYGNEERVTGEPLLGLLKSRFGPVEEDPISIYIEPQSRRISDISDSLKDAPIHEALDDDVALI